VSRKPRSERLPPKLPDPASERRERVHTGPSLREVLKQAHVAGRSLRYGRDEVTGIMRRVEQGAPSSLCGLPAPVGLTREQVAAAVELVYGWEGDGPRARID